MTESEMIEWLDDWSVDEEDFNAFLNVAGKTLAEATEDDIELVSELGSVDIELFAQWFTENNPMHHICEASWKNVRDFEEAYLGEISLEEWAKQYVEDHYSVPDIIANHVDYEGLAEDLRHEGFHEVNGHLFMEV